MIPREPAESAVVLLWQVLVKRWRLAAGFLGLSLIVVLVHLATATRYYQAAATVEIDPNAPMVLDVDAVNPLGVTHWDVDRYYRTQYRIIQSRAVLEEAARRLVEEQGVDLGEDPLGVLQGGLAVVPENETHLVRIVFEDTEPDRGAVIANAIAQAYIDLNVKRALVASAQALDWLREQQEVYRSKQYESDQRIEKFKQENGLVGDQVEGENGALASLERLQSAWSDAHTRRLQLEAEVGSLVALRRNQGAAAVAHTLVDSSTVLRDTLARLERSKQERAALESRYLDGMPRVQRANEEVAALEAQLGEQVDQLVTSRRAALQMVVDEERALATDLARVEEQVAALGKKMIELKFLRSEMERNKQFYTDLDTRLAEVGLANVLPINNLHLVDEARPGFQPVRPQVVYALAIGVFVGLIGGCLLVLGAEYFDDSVRSKEDIEDTVGVPFLGAMGRVLPAPDAPESVRQLVGQVAPRSAAAEALRLVRTAVQFSFPNRAPRRLLVTSAVPREGKSFVTANLSVIMAMAGQRVLAIDADMRRPTLHTLFGLENHDGLVQVLSADADPTALIVPTAVPGLDVLPAGTGLGNPGQILDPARIEALLAALGARYDLIIMDSPPVAVVGDALVLSTLVDGAIFVVEARRTGRRLAADATDRLKSVGARVVGAVVNKLEHGAGRYYGYGYGYGYGEYGSAYGDNDERAAR